VAHNFERFSLKTKGHAMNIIKKNYTAIVYFLFMSQFFQQYAMEINIDEHKGSSSEKLPLLQEQELFEYSLDQRDQRLFSELQKTDFLYLNDEVLNKIFSSRRKVAWKFVLGDYYNITQNSLDRFFKAFMREEMPIRTFSMHLQEYCEAENCKKDNFVRKAFRENNIDLVCWWFQKLYSATGLIPSDEKNWYLFFPYYENELMKWYSTELRKGTKVDGLSNELETMQKFLLGAALTGNEKVIQKLLRNKELLHSEVALNFEIGNVGLNDGAPLLFRAFQMALISTQLACVSAIIEHAQKVTDKKLKNLTYLFLSEFYQQSETSMMIKNCYEKKLAITNNVLLDIKYRNHVLAIAWLGSKVQNNDASIMNCCSIL
jgi:hypothetical protein